MNAYQRRTDPRTGTRYYQHRAVAEWALGRPLLPGEVVHHVNEVQGDDHPENLMVLPSARTHALLHGYLRREARGVQHLFDLETWLELRLRGGRG